MSERSQPVYGSTMPSRKKLAALFRRLGDEGATDQEAEASFRAMRTLAKNRDLVHQIADAIESGGTTATPAHNWEEDLNEARAQQWAADIEECHRTSSAVIAAAKTQDVPPSVRKPFLRMVRAAATAPEQSLSGEPDASAASRAMAVFSQALKQATPSRSQGLVDELRELFEREPEQPGADRIAARVGHRASDVRQALRFLRAQGEVEAVGRARSRRYLWVA